MSTIPSVVFGAEALGKKVCWVEIGSSRPPSTDPSLELRWEELVMRARTAGKSIWDSLLNRFEPYEINDDNLSLFVSTISFKEALVWARYEPHDHERIPFPLSAVVLPTTSDGLCLLGLRSSSLIYRDGEPCLIGGILSVDEGNISSLTDIEDALRRELQEEANVDPRMLSSFAMHGAIRTSRGGVVLVFTCRVETSAEEVQCVFNRRNDGELTAILTLSPSELFNVLEHATPELQVIRVILLTQNFVNRQM